MSERDEDGCILRIVLKMNFNKIKINKINKSVEYYSIVHPRLLHTSLASDEDERGVDFLWSILIVIGFIRFYLVFEMKIFYPILFFLVLISCDPIDYRLKLLNDSNQQVYCIHSFTEELSEVDSTVAEPYNKIAIKPQEEYTIMANYMRWEDEIERSSKDKKLRLYVFFQDTVKKHSWKEIIATKNYAKKYELTIPELEKTNWKIIYP